MQLSSLLFTFAAAASALGCGGNVTTSGSSNGGGAGSGGGTAGSGGSGGAALCPATPPKAGDPCTPPSDATFDDRAHCSWGDDPRPDCRTTALCQDDGTWSVSSPGAACDVSPLPAECPEPPPTSGAVCAPGALACWYPSGEMCLCSDCEGGTQYPICMGIDPPEWACGFPPDGCPATIPQAGVACDTPGLSCGPSCELDVVCENGSWVWRNGQCPICAAPTTPIATPGGERAIAELRAGDLVYSVDGEAIVVVPVLRAASTPVVRHHVVRVQLESGAVLEVSPGHPTADGRTFADLRAGGTLDGLPITRVDRVPYEHARTYDILPGSDTGSYFAAGARIGSTQRPELKLAPSTGPAESKTP